jgi:hypothetical protein
MVSDWIIQKRKSDPPLSSKAQGDFRFLFRGADRDRVEDAFTSFESFHDTAVSPKNQRRRDYAVDRQSARIKNSWPGGVSDLGPAVSM